MDVALHGEGAAEIGLRHGVLAIDVLFALAPDRVLKKAVRVRCKHTANSSLIIVEMSIHIVPCTVVAQLVVVLRQKVLKLIPQRLTAQSLGAVVVGLGIAALPLKGDRHGSVMGISVED